MVSCVEALQFGLYPYIPAATVFIREHLGISEQGCGGKFHLHWNFLVARIAPYVVSDPFAFLAIVCPILGLNKP